MNKNWILPVFGVISLLLVSMAIPGLRSNSVLSNTEAASEFNQRHPEWTWPVPAKEAAAHSDSLRHPELAVPAEASADLTDYYFRNPAQVKSGPDLTDYYFRHSNG